MKIKDLMESTSEEAVCAKIAADLEKIKRELGGPADSFSGEKTRKAVNMAWDSVNEAIKYLKFKA